MKKYLITLALCVLTLTASAQVFTAEQIERYAKDKYGDNWTEAAGNLSKEVALDNKNRLNYQEVIACAGQSKAEIFKKAIEWFNRAFKSKDTHGVIREQNAEQGLIITQAYIENIARQNAGVNHYQVDMMPYIRVDVKEEKARVSVYMDSYEVTVKSGGGWTSAIASVLAAAATGEADDDEVVSKDEVWNISSCYPYVEKDKHKLASSKAFVLASAFQNSIIDILKEALLADSSDGFSDDW